MQYEPDLAELAARLDCAVDLDLLRLAMTHRSYSYEHGGVPTNERLEFLGDSVLGLVVTESIFRSHPEMPEGVLAKMRSAVVNSRALAEVARTIGLGEFLFLGRGEESTDGRNKSSILADSVEAVIGAVFLSAGPTAAADLVHRLLDPVMANAASLGAGLDWKTSLQELTSELGLGVPVYVIAESGPDHQKQFTAQVLLGDTLRGHGEGPSKKAAEQQAAEMVFTELQAGRSPAGSDA